MEIAPGTAVYRVTNEAVISEEIRAQLFHRSFSTKGRGRGIGTYAARLFVEDFLGGRIDVSSGPGAGTTFSVALPLPF
jgi:signal transduction histidine kinase